MTYCRQLFPLFCIVSILYGTREEALTIVGNYAARQGQTLHKVDGYINYTTDPTIIITYDPALNDNENLSGEGIAVRVNSDENGSVDGWFTGAWVHLRYDVDPPILQAEAMGNDNTVTIQVPHVILNNIDGFPEWHQESYLDLDIYFLDDEETTYPVNWNHNIAAFENGSNDFLKRDRYGLELRDKVNVHSGWSGTHDDTISFSLQQIRIHPIETLKRWGDLGVNGDGTCKITFNAIGGTENDWTYQLGQACVDGNGDDTQHTTQVDCENAGNTWLGRAGELAVVASTISLPGDPLINDVIYDSITVQLYDEAGNKRVYTHHSYLRYDSEPPIPIITGIIGEDPDQITFENDENRPVNSSITIKIIWYEQNDILERMGDGKFTISDFSVDFNELTIPDNTFLAVEEEDRNAEFFSAEAGIDYYTAVINPTREGEIDIMIEAGVAKDYAGNLNTAMAAPFTFFYDTTPPTISSTSLQLNIENDPSDNNDNDDDEIVIAFTDARGTSVYNSDGEELELSDFEFSLSGGTATFVDDPPVATSIDVIGFNVTLGLPTNDGVRNGRELITIRPIVSVSEDDPPVTQYSIFDLAGNGAVADQNNNTVYLNDETPPFLIDGQQNPGVVYTEISTNEWPLESGNKYFNDNTPTLRLRARDYTSNVIILECKVNNAPVDIRIKLCSDDQYNNEQDCETAGETWNWSVAESEWEIDTSITEMKIMGAIGFGISDDEYDADDIAFYITDESNNILKIDGTNTYLAAASHPAVTLDTEVAIFNINDENHGTMFIDNSYVVVVFKEPVFGNIALGSAVSNLDITFNSNGGTATQGIGSGIEICCGCSDVQYGNQVECEAAGTCSDNEYKDQATCEGAGETWNPHTWTEIDGDPEPGDMIFAVLNPINGTPNGLEGIVISPGADDAVFDVAGNPTPTTEETVEIMLNDKTDPDVTVVTGLSGNTINSVLYVRTLSDVLSDVKLNATDARSHADDYSMQVSCEANGVTITIFPTTIMQSDLDLEFSLDDNPLMANGDYSGSFVFSVTDAAGNIGTVAAPDFIYDKTAPLISDIAIDAANDYITVTFAGEKLFSDIDGTGALVKTDFVITLSGGTATLNSGEPSYIKDRFGNSVVAGENVFLLGLDLSEDSDADGNEIITVSPAADNIFPPYFWIYDAAGNHADDDPAEHPNNAINLVDETAPTITISENLENIIDIVGNTVDGVKYVNDATPEVWLTASDARDEILELTCTVNGVPAHSINPTTLNRGVARAVTIGSLNDGDYDSTPVPGAVFFTVMDDDGNSASITLGDFTLDTNAPEFSSVVIDPSNSVDSPNSHMIVTFDNSEILYSLPTAEGQLTNDGIITLLGSNNLEVPYLGVTDIDHPYNGSLNKFRLSISLLNNYLPDGTEEITVTVGINTIYGRAGNAVINPDPTATSNDVTLVDQTPPKLVRADGSHPEIYTDISTNYVNGSNYFSDINPSVTLKATDEADQYLEIFCKVNGVSKNLNDDEIERDIATVITIEEALDPDDYGFNSEDGVQIWFYAEDDRGNKSDSAFCFKYLEPDLNNNLFNRVASLEPNHIQILDDQCIMAADNSYIDVVFSGGVYGDDEALTGLTAADFNITVNQNVDVGGLVTDCNIVSAKKDDSNIEGNATNLTGGETTVRVFLDFGGIDASGVETIEIGPSNNTSIYSRSTVATPSSETETISLIDKVPPTITITDIVGNTIIYGLEDTTYSSDPTPTFEITATDAKSTGASALTLSCQVDGDDKIIDITSLTSGMTQNVEITDELDDILYPSGMIEFFVIDEGNNQSMGSPSFFVLDTVPPTSPGIDTIITDTEGLSVPVPGYWGGNNTALNVTVSFPIPGDSSLLGGKIRLKAAKSVVGDPVWLDLGDWVDIPLDNEWTHGQPIDNVIVIITTAVFEGLDGFDENTSWDISAVVKDRALNTNFPDIVEPNGVYDNEDFNVWYNDLENPGHHYIEYQPLPIIIDRVFPETFAVGPKTSIVPVTAEYSVSRDYYWNIDTDSMTVEIDLPDDSTLNGGTVQLRANIDNQGFEDLGVLDTIISANTSKIIGIPDIINTPDNGVEELENFGDGKELVITAIVYDRAGNGTIWTRNTTDGPHNGAVMIDKTPAIITTITSTSANGWYMLDDVVNIRLEANEDIRVSGDTQLLLSTEGLATYALLEQEADSSIHDFSYVVGLDETSEPDTDANGDIDGLLEMDSIRIFVDKDIPNLELYVEGIKDYAGNFTPYNKNGTVHIPPANTLNALDYQAALHIDGIAPTVFTARDTIFYIAIDGISPKVRPKYDGKPHWEFDNGVYWNSTHTDLDVIVSLDRSDQSLANGSIQLKVSTAGSNAILDEFVNLSSEEVITPGDIAAGSHTVSFTASDVLGIGGFSDNAEIRITALIRDIAGNESTYLISEMNYVKVDTIAPDTVGISTGIIIEPYHPPDDIVPGYWNSMTGKIRIAIPLPDENIDITMLEGRIDLLGKVNTNTVWDTLGVLGDSITYLQEPDLVADTLFLYLDSVLATFNPGVENDTIGVEEIAGFADDRILEIKAVLYDRAGNPINYDLGPNATLFIDQTAPVINITTPANSSHGNTATVAYELTEAIQSGTITWRRIAGKEDPNSPHFQTLIGEELEQGSFAGLITNNPDLLDSAIYEIRFTATETAGNTINPYIINSFTFDTLAPNFSMLGPDSLAFINNSRVSYKISEDLASGQVSWRRISGVTEEENTVYPIDLVGDELNGGEHNNILPANDNEDFLVDGEIYNVTWTGIDKAGNPTRLEFISTEVVYDTTHPTAELIYNNYIVGEDYPLTITVNFSEPIRDDPLINIDYQGLNNDVQDTLLKDPDFDDGTVWYFNTLVPPGHNNSGIASVTIDAQDRASNPLLVYYNRDTLEVDNFLPSCQLHYLNTSQNWLINEGGGGDEIEIRGDFNKPITETLPVINIAYGDSTYASFAGLLPSDSAAAGSTFTWYVTLPGDSINSGSMLVDLLAYDRALSEIKPDSTFNDTIFIVDNIPPALGITDSIVPDTAGYNAYPGWINAYTQSIDIWAQIPEDPSLAFNRRGGIDVQIRNKNRPPSLWVTISIIGSSYGDSLTEYGYQPFRRSMAEITNISDTSDGFEPGVSLVHGDTLMFRLLVSDRVGNTTIYEPSNTMLVYDPIQPKIIVLNSGNMFTETALVSTDQITAGWSGSVDSSYQGFAGSGIREYKYKIMEYDTIPPIDTDTLTIVDWTSTGITVSFDTTLDLTPLNLYQVFITAVDTAGNELSTIDTTFDDDGVLSVEVIPTPVGSNVLPRHNTAPLIESFTANTAWEDILYTAQVMVTDIDVTTTKSDSFTYHIDWDTATTIGLEGPVLPDPDVDYPLGAAIAIDINTGAITWTPLPPDTGIFDVEIIVMDSWNFADTLTYPLTIFPVNDRPYFRSGEAWDTTYNLPDFPLPDTAMFEDSEEIFRLNLTQYILDEDNNDSTEITWQAIIEDTVTQPGYPRISLVFGPGTTELIKDQLRSKYLQGQQYKKLQGSDLQREFPDRAERSLAPLVNLELVQNDSSHITFAEIQADTNYWADNIKMTFIASDIEETFTLDSLLFDIVPINDRPRWIEIPEQDIIENDTLKFDVGAYVYDEDDTLLTFNTSILASWTIDTSGSWDYDLTGSDLTILPPEYTSTGLGDTLLILPDRVWSGYAFIEIIATDEQGARDTVVFRLNVKHVHRPHLTINVVQNNAFTNFFDVIITDTLEMARNVILDIENDRIELDTLHKFTYLGHTQFQDPGSYLIEVRAFGVVGDTLVERSIGLALARTLGRWGGSSPDGLFKVAAEPGAVNMDQSILVVDSTMFKKGYTGSYKLGDEVRVFTKPVEVSFASYDDALALYQRNTDNTWTELPSYNEQGRIRAYTDRMGYFRLGRKTLIVPGLTSLGQNYPNPFNPVTNITYDVGFVDGAEQQVNLSIYNLLGQQVITLVNDQRSIGRHSVKWYGKDKSGISVASGMYFVHMVTSTGKVQTKKVMLLR